MSAVPIVIRAPLMEACVSDRIVLLEVRLIKAQWSKIGKMSFYKLSNVGELAFTADRP